jgi:iron complex transport system ATP-binding protein
MDLEVAGLDVGVAARALVHSLHLQCRPGQLWCVLGRNGAGKSLLLKTLAGVRQVQSGSVTLGGRTLDAWPIAGLARQRAYLPQQVTDSFSASVLDTVLTARYPFHSRLSQRFGLESRDDWDKARAALGQLELAHLAARDVLSLSGGERAQVALATVFAQEVELLLLDEPAAHLDIDVSQRLFQALRQKTASGCCVVTSVHDPNLAARYASHVLLLLPGARWQAGPVELLSEQSLTELFGHPMLAIDLGGTRRFLAV